MMLVEYIAVLQALAEKHGGMLEVEKWMPAKGRHSAPFPELAVGRRYERGRVPQFYNSDHDTPTQAGDKVIRV